MLTGKGGLGYDAALSAADFSETEYLIHENKGRIRLILSSNIALEGFDLPLTRLILREPQLHLVPFILMLNSGRSSVLTRLGDRLTRVDDGLRKPFGINQLKESISKGQRRRASLRSSLLVLGPQIAPPLAEAFYACRNLVHWREVIPVSSVEMLDEKIKELGFRIGGIVLDPALCDASITARIAKFRKTYEGNTIPIALLSKNPAQIGDVRLSCDLFFDMPNRAETPDWEVIVLRMSRRTLLAWDGRELIAQGRQALNKNQLSVAASLAKRALLLDAERWEFNELAGGVAAKENKKTEAIEHFRAALETNPCSPFAYLNLIELVDEEQRAQILKLGESYCARHPQILAAIARSKGTENA
jgi:hypothetical protein